MRARDDFTDFCGNVLFGYSPAFNGAEQLARLAERGLLEIHEEAGARHEVVVGFRRAAAARADEVYVNTVGYPPAVEDRSCLAREGTDNVRLVDCCFNRVTDFDVEADLGVACCQR